MDDEWRRNFVGWHVVFATLAAMTAVAVLLDGTAGVSLAFLGALCVAYAVIGAKAVTTSRTSSGIVYLALAIPLTVGMFAVNPIGSVMLFMLYPHMWVLLPTKGAVVGTVSVIGATTVVIALAGEDLLFALILGLVTLLVSIAIGLWITRIIDQSEHRATLVVSERQRLAREIHDTLAQGFTAIVLQLEAIEAELGPDQRITKAKQVAKDNLAEARALVDALAPPDLRASTLPDALSRIAEAREAEWQLTGKPRALMPTHEVMLLRAAQEALTNAAKHANASTTRLALCYAKNVTLTVSDNGIGFDPGQRSTGFGLIAMRARAAETGAVLTIESAPGNGTTVRLEVNHAGADR